MSDNKLPEGWTYSEKWGFEWERKDPEEPLYSLVMSVESIRTLLAHIGLTVVPAKVVTTEMLNHELSELVQKSVDREAVGVPAILATLAVWLCSIHHEEGGSVESLLDVIRETAEDMEKDANKPELKLLKQVFPHDPKEPRTEEEEFKKSLRKVPDLRRYLPGMAAVFFFLIALLLTIAGEYMRFKTWEGMGWLK